jgi:hypothetical protein
VPSSGLLDGQNVTLDASGYGAGDLINVSERQAASPTSSCDFSTDVMVHADGTGAFTTSYRVTRLINPSSGPLDCAQPGACVITAEIGDQVATAPIVFADVVIKTPKLSVSPSTGLDDGQNVIVKGKGFRPHDEIDLTECVSGPPTAPSARPQAASELQLGPR